MSHSRKGIPYNTKAFLLLYMQEYNTKHAQSRDIDQDPQDWSKTARMNKQCSNSRKDLVRAE